nr:DNA cytosine methyltransferase [Terribacillus saccharophilus]
MQKKQLKVIDLFSGCGGFSYGFKKAGYDIYTGIDIEESAVHTASHNLHWKHGINRDHVCGDVKTFDVKSLKESLRGEDIVVIGGPPCQAYSQIGRAKLRSLGEDRIHTNDARGYLFQDFLKASLDLEAKVIVMENVLESVNYDGMNVPQLVSEILEESGYNAKWTVLNAANYGVPQLRERVFMIAIKDGGVTENFLPKPTHRPIDNKVTPGVKRAKKFSEFGNFIPAPIPDDTLPAWVTVEDSISDLPSLFPNAKTKYKQNPINLEIPYNSRPLNNYQEKMRSAFNKAGVSGHAFRRTARDFQIFERMAEGDNYFNASMIAEDILESQCRLYNIPVDAGNAEYIKLKKRIVPPYSREKFLNKWQRLKRDQPSHTLVAHLSTDTYSHIHPWEPRGISVREAARIQSFPDDFVFPVKMGDAFKQIGNAVPPLLSYAIANQIKELSSLNSHGKAEVKV